MSKISKRLILSSTIEKILSEDIIISIIKEYENKQSILEGNFRHVFVKINDKGSQIYLEYDNDTIFKFKKNNKNVILLKYNYIVLIDNVVHYSIIFI